MFNTNENGGWIIPEGAEVPCNTGIPSYSEIGALCNFGDDCKFGNYCNFGVGCKFGASTTIVPDCTLLNGLCQSFLTLANVDGSGRSILLVKHADGVKVQAGCFVGTLDEFIAKSKAEGKERYVAVVSAVAAVM